MYYFLIFHFYTIILILEHQKNFSSGYIDLTIGISLSCSFVTGFGLICGECFWTFVILSEILLPVKSPVTSAVFWITFFEPILSGSVAD